jgi:hypothetical protein
MASKRPDPKHAEGSKAGAPATVICLFRVKESKEAEFRALLDRHWPALSRAGLVTPAASTVYRGRDQHGPLFVEIFTWKDGQASGLAHGHPEVGPIWAAMDACVEVRGGIPKWEFPHVERIELLKT